MGMKKEIGLLVTLALMASEGRLASGSPVYPNPEIKPERIPERIPEKLPEPSKPRNNPKKLSRKKRKEIK